MTESFTADRANLFSPLASVESLSSSSLADFTCTAADEVTFLLVPVDEALNGVLGLFVSVTCK